MDLPARVTQDWIEQTLPTLTSEEADEIIEGLRGRRWSDEEIGTRVLPFHPKHTTTASGPRLARSLARAVERRRDDPAWRRRPPFWIEPGDFKPLLLTMLFLACGLFLIWFTKRVVGASGDALFVSELFFLVLVFLLLSGRVSELTAGGVSARFRDLAQGPVDPKLEALSPPEGQFVAKRSIPELRRQVARLSARAPVVLTMTVGAGRMRRTDPHISSDLRGARYDPYAISEYLRSLSDLRRFYFVVFVDLEGKLVGYLPARDLLRLMESEIVDGEAFASSVTFGDVEYLRSLPGFITSVLNERQTNAEALDEMLRLTLEAIVVVTGERRLVGIIERERIVGEMLLALARQASAPKR